MDIIKVQGLSKSYGNKNVLNDISFDLPQGEIIGLFGPNGCGKTTLMKILTGLIHDYSGSVLVNGEKPGENTKAITAYLPEQTFVHEWMRNIDAVNYFNDFFKDFDKNKALELMQRFDLPLKQKSKTMSKGMQEKLQLLLVMCRNAKLYILDEPMGGVDPAARDFILETILRNRPEGSTILMSTHLIQDVEEIFDSILMIGRGSLLMKDTVANITQSGKTINDIFKEVFSVDWNF